MSNPTADVIAYNGKIATQNEQWSIVEAVAIRDGKFLAVGTDREMMASRGDQSALSTLVRQLPTLDVGIGSIESLTLIGTAPSDIQYVWSPFCATSTVLCSEHC